MTQLEPRLPTGAPPPPDDGDPTSPRREPGFNWRVSLGMFVGLAILFGVLFGLRALHLFPPEPGQDPEIAAARATQTALETLRGAARPTATESALGTTTSAPAQQPFTAPQPTPLVTTGVGAPPTQEATTVQPVAVAPPATTPISATTTAPAQQPIPTSSEPVPTPVQVALPADLAAAILQAYSNYWSVRVNAMRDPSDSTVDLESVMAASELIGARKTLAQYRDAGEAFETTVQHQIWITKATPDEALVVDQFTANLVRVNPETKEPLGIDPKVERRTDAFLLHRFDGVWKVVDEPEVRP